jgi:hypothetical protein
MGEGDINKGVEVAPSEVSCSSQVVTATWKVFFLKYVMTTEGACAARGLKALIVTPAALVSIHFLFAKVSEQNTSSIFQDKFSP